MAHSDWYSFGAYLRDPFLGQQTHRPAKTCTPWEYIDAPTWKLRLRFDGSCLWPGKEWVFFYYMKLI